MPSTPSLPLSPLAWTQIDCVTALGGLIRGSLIEAMCPQTLLRNESRHPYGVGRLDLWVLRGVKATSFALC